MMRSKQQYRSSIQIIRQILEIIINSGRDGASVSTIARDSRTGHRSLVEKCQKLADAGLLSTSTGHKSRRYYITEEGIRFFALINKYENLLQTISAK